MPEQRAAALLARWRELERQLESADAELRAAVTAEIERVRAEYDATIEEIRRRHDQADQATA